jgi:hypothetical protein
MSLRKGLEELFLNLFLGLKDSLLGLSSLASDGSPLFCRAYYQVLQQQSLFLLSYYLYASFLVPYITSELDSISDRGVLWSLVYALFGSETLFIVLWSFPMYLYSLYVNSLWHSEIAAEMSQHDLLKQSNSKEDIRQSRKSESALSSFTDTVYRGVLYNVMLLFSFLSTYFPVIGPLLQAMMYAWLYSIYCFEFKWRAKGWGLLSCVDFFEQRWCYFVGFGAPVVFIGYLQPSFFVTYAVTSIVLPLFFASAMLSEPRPQKFVFRLRMRELSEGAILRPLVSRMSAKRARKRQTNK